MRNNCAEEEEEANLDQDIRTRFSTYNVGFKNIGSARTKNSLNILSFTNSKKQFIFSFVLGNNYNCLLFKLINE